MSNEETFADKVRNWGRKAKNTALDIKDAAPTIAKEIGSSIIGSTPSEMAFNAALLPFGGPLTKSVMMGAAALLRDQEAQGVLLNAAKGVPSRLDKFYKIAQDLLKLNRGHEIFDATKGQMTVNPAGEIQAIYRPKEILTGRIKTIPTDMKDIVKHDDLYKEVPGMGQIGVSSKSMDPGKLGNYNKGQIQINRHFPQNDPVGGGRIIQHEGKHAFDDLLKLPNFGTNPTYEGEALRLMHENLRKHYPYMTPDQKADAARLFQKWKDPNAAQRTYGRNIREVDAEASSTLVPGGKIIDPYMSERVSSLLRNRPGSIPRMEGAPYERLMTETSPLLPDDVFDVAKRFITK